MEFSIHIPYRKITFQVKVEKPAVETDFNPGPRGLRAGKIVYNDLHSCAERSTIFAAALALGSIPDIR